MAIIEKPEWALSVEKRAVPLVLSSENPEHPIILIGGVHGDEPEGVALAQATLHWLTNQTDTSALAPWMVVPCLNPDGIAKKQRTNGNGVDLNRNYPSRDWSPESTSPRYNPGPSPGSEPEIRALVGLIHTVTPRLIIHCHSWNPCIIYTGEMARSDAESLGRSSQYEVRDNIGYPTTGSLSRYGWHDHGIPIICIEEAEHTPEKEIWSHFAKGIEEIFKNHSLRNIGQPN